MNLNARFRSPVTEAKPARDLDAMAFERMARGLMAFRLLRVYGHNPDCLFALARASSTLDALRAPAGFVAQLPLNRAGARALFTGDIDTADPDIRFLCRQNERPDAIYIWGIFVSHKLAGGIALVMERLSSMKNRDAPQYCKATSEKSRDFFLTLGFRSGVLWRGNVFPEFMEYPRGGGEAGSVEPLAAYKTDRAPYDTVEEPAQAFPGHSRVGITVVHRLDDLLKVLSVRAATFIADQNCPYTEEFDGNDLTATHLLGFVDSEPAGCLRIRYFAEFAKLERLAVISRFRQTRVAHNLIKAGIAFCRSKGYRKLYGHAEPRFVKLWERFGFRARTVDVTFSFSNLEFIEGDVDLAADPDALTSRSDPYVLVRPEGQWDRPGVLCKKKY
jgi:predicted GNAT family N-acyltransferase